MNKDYRPCKKKICWEVDHDSVRTFGLTLLLSFWLQHKNICS